MPILTRHRGATSIRYRYAPIVMILSTACTQMELADERLREAGRQLGASSIALVQTPTDAPPDVLERQLATLEDDLLILVRGHDALGLANDGLPELALDPLEGGGETRLTWDGEQLEVRVDGLDGSDTRVEGAVRFQGYRLDSPQLQGTDACFWGHPTGDSDGNVECPPFIDRALTFTRPSEGITVFARFGIVLDGDNCAAGGQVELDYVVRGDALEPRGGTLEASYEGCESVRILSPK